MRRNNINTQLTEALRKEFSLDGKIKIGDFYCKPKADNSAMTYTTQQIQKYEELISKEKGLYYCETDIWLYQALKKHSIKDKEVIIIGSEQPWYETIACVYSGNGCSCLEYNKRICESDKIKYYQYDTYNELPKFDACISISSIEHSGLGRYGDNIDPMGDIKAMQDIKNILKKDGLFFLAVPIGEDRVMWNAHRVYGKIRLELLLDGWECIDTYGMSDELLVTDRNSFATIQPVLVLRNI
jgi:SAM-dependent methyltransferase